ncbi:unnamed protein product [Adineta steineri]|uniref:SecA family profile domain-containing protein n=1 Tax=Adineta steineri TaxID=433720 RepID=A0A819FK71_9BILA|nr:unnamed protein product [Adineta steineri]CAF3870361.1 unnamed protein product [Adineta steineri]
MISISIAKKLEAAREQSPDHFPKPVIVLPPVDESTSGQWEERLRQANEGYTGEHVTLIPYHVQDTHWIGVIMQFNAAEQLQRAEYFDPVLASSFDDIKCQKRFNSVYPSISLQSKVYKQHEDPVQSVKLTAQNLLTAAKEVYSKKTGSPSQQNLGEESSADPSANTSYSFVNDMTDLSTSATYSGNRQEHCDRLSDLKLEKHQFSTQNASVTSVKVSPTAQGINDFTLNTEKSPSKLGEHKIVSYSLQSDPFNSVQDRQVDAQRQLELHKILKNELDSKLEESEIENLEELEKQILAKRENIASLEKQGKHKTAQQRKDSLSKLEAIQCLAQRIKALKPKPSNDEYFALKAELDNKLEESEIENLEELETQILAKRENIALLEKQGKHKTAQQRKDSLSNLQEIQCLAERIKALEAKPSNDEYSVLKPKPSNDEYIVLKAELHSKMEELEIANLEELETEILAKKENIILLEKQGKNKTAQQRKDSLSKLEETQSLAERVKAMEPKFSNGEYFALKAELDIKLEESEIGNLEELEKQILAKRENIASLEKQGKHKTAQQRRDSFSKLEKIQYLAERVKTLEPKLLNDKYLALKAELDNKLEESEIENLEELETQILAKRGNIVSLKKQGKHKTALQRKDSLSKLEEIQSLAESIKALEQKPLINEVQVQNENIIFDLIAPEILCTEEIQVSIPFNEKSVESMDNTVKELSARLEQEQSSMKNSSDTIPVQTDSGSAESKDLQDKDNSITKDSLIDLYNDFNSLSMCCDKHIAGLLFYSSVKLADKALLSACKVKLPQEIEKEMIGEIESLKQRLVIEELQSESIGKLVKSCEIHINNENWRSSLIELKKLWKIISPLHMQELRRLVGKVDEAAKLIEDKNIILLIGGTGAGKSTTIHFLGGSTMSETVVNGMNHIAPVIIKNLDLKNIATAPSATSVTRYISPVTVNFKDIGGRGDDGVILCDSPGFEDTSGPEVDIANGIGIVKAIKGCQSVKPVVLVSYKSIGDRCTGVKDLAHMLTGLIPIEKIDVAVGKKSELSTLEQFMAELDAIRTISSFDIKTTQSYFSILEKLIGYINECRRDAEKLLLALFRQEKVDFNKLASCLMGLKSAQWIEKYRTGVYSDIVGNVERQILEELDVLKKTVMQTNLDLDSSDKIKNVYQIIMRINEIKRLDKFFPSIDEQAYKAIKEAILTKFRQELDSAKSKVPPSTENIHIRKFESAVKYLPKDMKESLEDELKHCKEDIEGLLRDNDNRLTNALESGDLKTIKAIIEEYKSCDEKNFFEKIQSWETMIETGKSIDSVKNGLINMKYASNHFPQFKVKIHEKIDTKLAEMKKKDPTAFGKLGNYLNQDETGIGQSIVAEHKAFQGLSLSLFNEKTQKHGIEYVLNNLQGDLCDKNKLKKRYDEFYTIYESLIKQYLKPNVELGSLIDNTKLLAGDIKQQPTRIEWDASLRSNIPKLAAHIFALWTLQSAYHYFEATEVENKKSYLLQPHAAQVVSIFRMLGIGDDKEELKNNLVQIGTGEGKSVTLGATASILALLGFDVCCACYSEYLSQRDYASFLSLFDSLGVLSNVHYGTFNTLCEYIINDDGNIRQVVEQLILTDSNSAVEKAKFTKRAKILLIDEADVFFSQDFYGNVYAPVASLEDPTITALINYLWTYRKSKLTLNKVKETEEYKNCCARFSNWEALIQEAVKDMLADVISFESHEYIVKDDKVGYIEQDNIIFNAVYGYKTLFAYYFEHEKGKIGKKSLDEKICITIKCGGFSYAEIPIQFQYIMGVTGTLNTLSDPEKAIIRNVYKIHKQTITPSVFGQNNLKFSKKDDIMIESSDDYFNVIKREIDDRLQGKTDKRAVLVFLESEKKLKEFYASKALSPIKDSVIILTEEASPAEKESIIKRATGSGQITLFTKTFGRGTDFICHDPTVDSNGGIHVIQTFLSEEISEEVQIKGRTARQGDRGSYSLILLYTDLEKFRIERVDIENVKDGKGSVGRWFTNAIGLTDKCDSVYDLMNDRRMAFFKTQYEANTKYVEQAKKRHDSGQKFLSSLKSGDNNSVKEFLTTENKGAEDTSGSRTICLMDATVSMSHLLQKSKNTVGIMFERAAVILKEHHISLDSFEIQFVVYRNYCCPENKILQHSPWETKPDNLRAFMNTINVEGGLGNEAIEIALWHANKENERENITQVILIGDAPPNTKSEMSWQT